MRVNLFPNNKIISQKLDLNVPERRFLLYIVTYFKNDWEDILRTKNVFFEIDNKNSTNLTIFAIFLKTFYTLCIRSIYYNICTYAFEINIAYT